MKFGLFTCGYQRTALEKAFADAKAFGYDYIELWVGRPHAYGPDLIRDDSRQLYRILELKERYEMPVPIYTPEHNAYPFNYMLGDEISRRESLEYLKCCIKAAGRVGADYMLVSAGHGGDASKTQRHERLAESLKELAFAAEQEGIILLLEPLTRYESNTCTTLGELEQVLDEVAHDCLLGMCDLAVPYTSGEDPAEYVRRLGRRMGHLHLTDNDGLSDTHLIPGTGTMPLKEILRDLTEAGYGGSATIELVTHYIDAPGEACGAALMYVRKLMKHYLPEGRQRRF